MENEMTVIRCYYKGVNGIRKGYIAYPSLSIKSYIQLCVDLKNAKTFNDEECAMIWLIHNKKELPEIIELEKGFEICTAKVTNYQEFKFED